MINRRILLAGLGALAARSALAEPVLPADGDMTARLQRLIDAAAEGSGIVEFGAGTFRTDELAVRKNVVLRGIPGKTTLRTRNDNSVLHIHPAASVTLEGLGFSSKGDKSELVVAKDVKRLVVSNCSFAGGSLGLYMERCGGRIVGSSFSFIKHAGVYARDAAGMEISGNDITDMGNSGIRVWRGEKAEDGTIISNNRIARVAAEDGGTGENGNGISIFKADNVVVSNNRVSDCEFSAIRNNSGSNSIITGNSISRCNETALYVEFVFDGANVSNNIIEDTATGISVTNFNEGGRLAVVDGNVIRRVTGRQLPTYYASGTGIYVEADSIVSNNIVEEAKDAGIVMGWGAYHRNVLTTGNILRKCGKGIGLSVVGDKHSFVVSGNLIEGSKAGAIIGMDHEEVVTGDLTLPNASVPAGIILKDNEIRS